MLLVIPLIAAPDAARCAVLLSSDSRRRSILVLVVQSAGKIIRVMHLGIRVDGGIETIIVLAPVPVCIEGRPHLR